MPDNETTSTKKTQTLNLPHILALHTGWWNFAPLSKTVSEPNLSTSQLLRVIEPNLETIQSFLRPTVHRT